jgi:hypothetical protein
VFRNTSYFPKELFDNLTNNSKENSTQPLVIKLGPGKTVFVCIFTALVIVVIIFLHYKTTTKLKNNEMKRPIYRSVPFVLPRKIVLSSCKYLLQSPNLKFLHEQVLVLLFQVTPK